MFLLAGKSPCYVSRASRNGQRDWIDRILHATVRGAFRLHPFDARRRYLAGCESVDLVVHYKVGQVHISPHGMDEVVSSDPVAIAVAASRNDLQFMIGKLRACGNGQSTTVQRMHAVDVNIARQVGRAADATNGHHLMGLEFQLDKRLLERSENTEIPTARTPIRVHFPLEVLDGQLGAFRPWLDAAGSDIAFNHYAHNSSP